MRCSLLPDRIQPPFAVDLEALDQQRAVGRDGEDEIDADIARYIAQAQPVLQGNGPLAGGVIALDIEAGMDPQLFRFLADGAGLAGFRTGLPGEGA